MLPLQRQDLSFQLPDLRCFSHRTIGHPYSYLKSKLFQECKLVSQLDISHFRLAHRRCSHGTHVGDIGWSDVSFCRQGRNVWSGRVSSQL